ncbi:integrase, partial [Enterococcus faecium]
MTYTHLTPNELVMIEAYFHQETPVAIVAKQLKRCLKRTNPIPHSSVMFNLNNLKLEDLYYSENITRVVDYEL